MDGFEAYLLVAVGLFAMLGGILDWEWFMNNRKARIFVALLGRSGARIFYVVLGLGVAGIGGALAAGLIEGAAR